MGGKVEMWEMCGNERAEECRGENGRLRDSQRPPADRPRAITHHEGGPSPVATQLTIASETAPTAAAPGLAAPSREVRENVGSPLPISRAIGDASSNNGRDEDGEEALVTATHWVRHLWAVLEP